jgi:3-hydroxyisobutyrate dehydrogenase-like beta-hydroxyacid dehydrogenase
MKRVGFVGLGNMGLPMATRLVSAGFEVTGFDLDTARVEALARRGARRATTLGDAAAGRDAVLVSLPGPPEVEAAGRELLGLMPRGSVLVSLSTVAPGTVRTLAEAAARIGVDVVDAPVTGAADGAAAGTLTAMAGADVAVLERVRPLLAPLARSVIHIGPVGAGSAAKLLTNMLWFVHVVALADALALAARAGIAPETMAELVPQSAGASWVADHDLPHLLAGHDDPTFTLALCRKDLLLVAELAEGYPAELARVALARFEEACGRFGPEAGELAVARLAEEAAGASIRAGAA